MNEVEYAKQQLKKLQDRILPSSDKVRSDINLENFDETGAAGAPYITSPRSIEACLRHGIEPPDLIQKKYEDFKDKDEKTQQLKYERHEKRRQDWLQLVRQEREDIIRRGEKDLLVNALDEGGLERVKTMDLSTLDKDKKRFEQMKRRQKAEIEQMLREELQRQQIEERSAAKERLELQRQRELEQQRLEHQKALEKKRYEIELLKRKQEEEEQKKQEIFLKRMRKQEQRKLEMEEAERREREKEAKRRQAEVMEKAKERERQLKEQERQKQKELRRKQRLMEEKERQREQKIEEQKKELAVIAAKKREESEQRIARALELQAEQERLREEEMLRRQEIAEERRKAFEEEQALRIEEQRRQAEEKAQAIEEAQAAMKEEEKRRKDMLLAKADQMEKRLQELEEQKAIEVEEKARKQREKEEKRRIAKEKAEKLKAQEKEEILRRREEKEKAINKVIEQQKQEAEERERLAAIKEEERKEALARVERIKEYKRLKTLAKLGMQETRVEVINTVKEETAEQQRLYRTKTEKDRLKLMVEFEKLRSNKSMSPQKMARMLPKVLGDVIGEDDPLEDILKSARSVKSVTSHDSGKSGSKKGRGVLSSQSSFSKTTGPGTRRKALKTSASSASLTRASTATGRRRRLQGKVPPMRAQSSNNLTQETAASPPQGDASASPGTADHSSATASDTSRTRPSTTSTGRSAGSTASSTAHLTTSGRRTLSSHDRPGTTSGGQGRKPLSRGASGHLPSLKPTHPSHTASSGTAAKQPAHSPVKMPAAANPRSPVRKMEPKKGNAFVKLTPAMKEELERLRKAQNQTLLQIVEKEREKEKKREAQLKAADNEEEAQRLEAQFRSERQAASERIMKLTEMHEVELSARMSAFKLQLEATAEEEDDHSLTDERQQDKAAKAPTPGTTSAQQEKVPKESAPNADESSGVDASKGNVEKEPGEAQPQDTAGGPESTSNGALPSEHAASNVPAPMQSKQENTSEAAAAARADAAAAAPSSPTEAHSSEVEPDSPKRSLSPKRSAKVLPFQDDSAGAQEETQMETAPGEVRPERKQG